MDKNTRTNTDGDPAKRQRTTLSQFWGFSIDYTIHILINTIQLTVQKISVINDVGYLCCANTSAYYDYFGSYTNNFHSQVDSQ